MKALQVALLAALCAHPIPLRAQPDAELVFAEANELFRQANQSRTSDPQQAAAAYRRAALRYESLIQERGIVNSKLYYNLGNAHFQLGDIGQAILNYRRAERVDPGDPNVLRNLEHARATRKDKLDSAGGSQVLETLLFWHYDFAWATRTRLLAGAWLAFWAVLLLRLFGQAWVPREVAVVSGVAAGLLLASLAVDAFADRTTVAGVIVATETVARQGDGRSYEPSFEDPLHAGAEFRVLEERPDWYRVELPDGRICWLRAADVQLVR